MTPIENRTLGQADILILLKTNLEQLKKVRDSFDAFGVATKEASWLIKRQRLLIIKIILKRNRKRFRENCPEFL